MVKERLGILALCLVGGTLANTSKRKQGPWNLPPYSSSASRPGRAFLDECESLASFIASIRGGSDPYYRKSGRGKDYRDDYSRYSRYGGPDDPTDDDEEEEARDNYDDYSYSGGQERPARKSRRDSYYDYDDKKTSSGPDVAAILQSIPNIIQNGDRRVGVGLLGSGLVITMLGVSLFFNKALMRLGNLLFIAGVPMMLGPSRTLGYFLKPEKMRATACLGLGIFLVLVGSPVFGIALEIFGLLNLFGNMFPVFLAIAKQLPVIGPILSGNNSNNSSRNDNDRYSSRQRYDDRTRDQYYGDDDYNDRRGYGDADHYDDYGRRDGYDREDRDNF